MFLDIAIDKQNSVTTNCEEVCLSAMQVSGKWCLFKTV